MPLSLTITRCFAKARYFTRINVNTITNKGDKANEISFVDVNVASIVANVGLSIEDRCYEPRANRYYSSRIALHKVIKKGRSIDRIKMIKMA